MKVFVYGTLKRGGSLYLGDAFARKVRPSSIQGDLYKYKGVFFPFADVDGDGIIHGEIHEYDPQVLPTLDRIENGYRRRTVVTHCGEIVYVYHYPYIDQDFTLIESGVWEE